MSLRVKYTTVIFAFLYNFLKLFFNLTCNQVFTGEQRCVRNYYSESVGEYKATAMCQPTVIDM